jgi:hypothetical protein
VRRLAPGLELTKDLRVHRRLRIDEALQVVRVIHASASRIEYRLLPPRKATDTLTSLALIAGGAAIALFGAYFWKRPELYDRYFHERSAWAFSDRTPRTVVLAGAAATVVIGLLVCGWGLIELAS